MSACIDIYSQLWGFRIEMKPLSKAFESLAMIFKSVSSRYILISMSWLQNQYYSLTERSFQRGGSEQLAAVYPEATVTVCDQGVRPEECMSPASSRSVSTITGSGCKTLLFFIASLFRNQREKPHKPSRSNSSQGYRFLIKCNVFTVGWIQNSKKGWPRRKRLGNNCRRHFI